MNTEVTLNIKEQKRLTVLNDLDSRLLTIREASVALGITVRHVSRVRARYRLQGAAALAHGNRGRPSPHRLPSELRDQVVELVRKEYFDCNDYHLTDLLSEEYGIQISRSSTRRTWPKASRTSMWLRPAASMVVIVKPS